MQTKTVNEFQRLGYITFKRTNTTHELIIGYTRHVLNILTELHQHFNEVPKLHKGQTCNF